MKTHQKIIIGGMGALTPIIMNLLVVDLPVMMINITILVLVAYLVKVIVLFYLGGLVAYLHKDEQSPLKLFELGIMAPALIMVLVNGIQREVNDVAVITPEEPAVVSTIIWSPHMLYAGDPPIVPLTPVLADSAARDSVLNIVEIFDLPKESTLEEIKRGLLGSISDRVYFVVVAKDTLLANAKELAKAIMKDGEGYMAQVYAPYDDDVFYSVVIGAHLTYEDAIGLRKSALQAGFLKSTHIWTFPK